MAAQRIVRRDFRSPIRWTLAVELAAILLLVPLCAGPLTFGKPSDDSPGEITVAQPKIYEYERVNTLLDGLLRDVEGVSLSDLTALNPNATNGAAVRFVQSMLEIGAQYNQGAAVSNAIALQNYQATQGITSAQIAANSQYLQQLYQQRQTVTTQLLAEEQQQVQLQTSAAAATGDAATSLQAQATAAGSAVTELQQELTSINSQIAAASTAPAITPPTLTPTTGGTPQETANTFSDFLSKLPSGIQQDINSQLQSPSLPATKQLDNFITLLYERLAREVSALQDDIMRDPQNAAYLVQFDVGLYPSNEAKDRVAKVKFTLDCGGCKVYSIYPGQSSYNLANYEGASKRNNIFFSLATLFGFGINADYRRQEDTLRGDLVQSVYMAGFQGVAGQQDFGWYYGAAPFEKLVTPGMRSTFAIITVPRDAIRSVATCPQDQPPTSLCQDGEENVQMPVAVDVSWTRRDNPSDEVAAGSRLLTVILPTSDDLAVPVVVAQERDHLHVLGMEYNPVYSPASKPAAPGSTPTTPPAPGTAQATASGTGTGSATVTVSGAGTASASSTGTGATTANATATNPAATPSGTPGTPAPTDSFTGCPVGQCAAVLIKLAEPIDPNLVVTVRGEPLRRVRDWRGRATSILPPVQSESDFPPAAPAAGTTAPSSSTAASRYEAVASRSLLEADQLGPDTWLEVDSHRLLLNISKNLAGSTDFPSIQIVAPGKRALFIPTDLDEGYTEIVTNGFHLPTRDGVQLGRYLCLHLRGSRDPQQCSYEAANWGGGQPDLADAWKELYPSGPYPYETFLPLFLPQPGDQPIYAYLGETGVQLLITFADDPLNGRPKTDNRSWLASRTQVMLEDEDLDLAWSLDCYPQGTDLVCDVPRQEMRDAYTIVQEICSTGTCLSTSGWLGDFPSISTLQVWVEQFDPDPDGDNYFHSAVPARLGRFPVQKGVGDKEILTLDELKADDQFKPWHFESATADAVTATECQYPKVVEGTKVRLLGRQIPGDKDEQPLKKSPTEKDCFSMQIPTVALTHPELAITYEKANSAPESLLTLQFRPSFDKPLVIPHRDTNAPFAIKWWKVEIPATRVDYDDKLDAADATAKFDPQWVVGSDPISIPRPLPRPKPAGWDDASKNGQIQLVLTINKTDLGALPEHRPIDLLRGSNRVGRLPDLWSALLPTKLTAKYISATQFSLGGTNAGAIDAVSLQGPGAPNAVLPATGGADFVLVTLPVATKSSSDAGGDSKPTIGKPSPAKGAVAAAVIISAANLGAKGKVTFTQGKSPKEITKEATIVCWNSVNLGVTVPDGLTAGAATINVTAADGTAIGTQSFTVTNGKANGNKSACKQPPVTLTAGTYAVLPLVALDDTGQNYLPLDVTDKDGNALTFTVPAQPAKNDNSNTDQSGKTTTITITKKTTGDQTAAATPPAAKPAAQK